MAYTSEECAKIMINETQNLIKTNINHMKRPPEQYRTLYNMMSKRQYHIFFTIKYLNLNTVTEIAKALTLSNACLSLLISKSVAKGHLQKKYPTETSDGRKIIICLTENGEKELNKLIQKILMDMEEFIKVLPKEYIKNVSEGYRKIASITENYEKIDLYKDLETANQKTTEDLPFEMLKSMICLMSWLFEHYFKEFDTNGKKKDALTLHQFRILSIIKAVNESSIVELSEILCVSESTTSTAIKKLTLLGYLTKERANTADDGRKKICCMTESGMEILEEMESRLLKKYKSFFENLDEDKQETLYEGLKLIEKSHK